MPICVFILLILHLYVFESTMNKQRSITFTFTWHQPGILQLLVPSSPILYRPPLPPRGPFQYQYNTVPAGTGTGL